MDNTLVVTPGNATIEIGFEGITDDGCYYSFGDLLEMGAFGARMIAEIQRKRDSKHSFNRSHRAFGYGYPHPHLTRNFNQ